MTPILHPLRADDLTAYSLTTATGVVEVDDASSETTGVVDDDSDSRT
jgi:hypothetical protein